MINPFCRVSFNDCLDGIRVQKGQSLLCITSYSLGRIAESVGFADQSYLGKFSKSTPEFLHACIDYNIKSQYHEPVLMATTGIPLPASEASLLSILHRFRNLLFARDKKYEKNPSAAGTGCRGMGVIGRFFTSAHSCIPSVMFQSFHRNVPIHPTVPVDQKGLRESPGGRPGPPV